MDRGRSLLAVLAGFVIFSCVSCSNGAFLLLQERVVFMSLQSLNDPIAEIMIAPADGSAPPTSITHFARTNFPSFAPGTGKIVFVADNDRPEANVEMIDSDGSNPHAVTTVGRVHMVSITRDGSKIAYESDIAGDVIINADGTGATTVGQADAFLIAPDGGHVRIGDDVCEVAGNNCHTPQFVAGAQLDWNFAPDGQHIVYPVMIINPDFSEDWSLHIANLDGSGERLLLSCPAQCFGPTPLARRIGYSQLIPGPLDTYQIHTIEPDGTGDVAIPMSSQKLDVFFIFK